MNKVQKPCPVDRGSFCLNMTFLLQFTNAVSSELKRRETFQYSEVSISDGLEPHQCKQSGQPACFRCYAEKFQSILWRTSILEKVVFQQDNAKLQTAAITTKWIHRRRVQVPNRPVCSPDVSPIEHLVHHSMKHTLKMTTNSSAAGKLYQHQNSSNSKPQWPNIFKCFEQKRRCCTQTQTRPNFFTPVVSMAFSISLLRA